MGVTVAGGIPIAIDATSSSPHEITFVDNALDSCFLEELPERLIEAIYGLLLLKRCL